MTSLPTAPMVAQGPAKLALGVALLVGLSGCALVGGALPQEESTPDPPPVEEAAPTSTPSPVADPPIALVDTWTNSSGYSYAVELRTVELETSSVDIENAQPGFADIELIWSVKGLWRNETDGRVGSLTERVILVALWPVDSPACTGRPALGGFCTLGGENFLPSTSDLPVGAELPVAETFALGIRVAESELQARLEAYTHPAGWGFARRFQPSDVGDPSGCAVASSWDPRLSLVAATVETGCQP